MALKPQGLWRVNLPLTRFWGRLIQWSVQSTSTYVCHISSSMLHFMYILSQTNSMEQSPFWEVNISPVVKKFPAFYGTWRFINVLQSGIKPNSETDQLVPHQHNVFISFIVHPYCYICKLGLFHLYITVYYNVYTKYQIVTIMKSLSIWCDKTMITIHSPIQHNTMVWYNINLMKLIKIPDKLTLLKTVKTHQLNKSSGSVVRILIPF